MIRAIVSATILGALIAAGFVYAGREPAWRSQVTGWLRPYTETSLATETWPICTAMTTMGTESDWTELDPDFAAGKRALVAQSWDGAIVALKLAALRDPRNADIQNYIGYSYWRLGDMGPAMGHYQQALMFNPRHRSAREHLGELYLSLGEPSRADEQLVALREICLIACDELTDLERAIATHKAIAQRPRSTVAF
jgi:tetratricopeptide (TPR) repeat protein